MASFDAINYTVRPNKGVERKLVFSGLSDIARKIDLHEYRYIGLGSIWFVDFLLAHRILNISRMSSIEGNQLGYRRAKFNQPLSCIDVVHGDTAIVLPNMDLSDTPTLAWFDYDSGISTDILTDLNVVLSKCLPNSIIIVTLSAKKDDLIKFNDTAGEGDDEIALRRIAGDLVPNPLPPRRLRKNDYPRLIGDIVSNHFASLVSRSGRPETWVKIFDIIYSDSTFMVTIGGMLASPASVIEIKSLVGSPSWTGIVAEPISIPPLTLKEKMTLDKLMPADISPTVEQVEALGFPLKQAQIDAYHRHYRHYPVFGELIF